MEHAPISADTHVVTNVSRELADYNAYLQDAALQEAVRREGAAWAHDDTVGDAATVPDRSSG